MRIKIGLEEYQISGIRAKGNTIAGGHYVAHEGILCEGIEDITVYKLIKNDEGEEVKVEVIPVEGEEVVEEEVIVQPERPPENAIKDVQKAFMDAYHPPIAYNSGDTKNDLLDKIALILD